jgi:hypothetical protein
MYAIREVSANTAFHSLVLDISELLNQKKYLTQD